MSLVHLSNVSKVYRSLKGSDYVAVQEFSLEIQNGEFFCLLGTSGRGKEIAQAIAGYFKYLPRAGHDRLRDGLISGGFVSPGATFEQAVDNSLAELVIDEKLAPLT